MLHMTNPSMPPGPNRTDTPPTTPLPVAVHDADSEPPSLGRDRAFWGMTSTQFLGAFNDNMYKQLMLLLAIPIGAAAASSEDQQDIATIVFSLPFVLFSGIAGFLSDRFSKSQVIFLSKVAEIARHGTWHGGVPDVPHNRLYRTDDRAVLDGDAKYFFWSGQIRHIA